MIAHAVIEAVKDISMHLQTVINRITILMVCNKFSHTMQAFYKERKIRVIKAIQTDKILDHVIEIRHENPREGGKKLHIELSETMRKEGIYIGVNKFFGLLKDYDLLVERRKAKTCRTTRQDPSMIPAKNLVKHMVLDGPYQAFCCDITYIRVGACFIFLALVTDMYTRCILGYAISMSLDSSLVVDALMMAKEQVPEGYHPVVHSDRGSQYGSKAYRTMLESYNWEQSMTEVLHCYENGMAERVNGILKGEYFLDMRFGSMKEAISAIDNAIYRYNNRRLHTSLGYKTPKAFEKECLECRAA